MKYSYEEVFQRNIGILTPQAQDLLRNETVPIAGCGGGGMVAESLVRAGVGHIRIADFDTYQVHNVGRQNCAFISTIGSRKTHELSDRLKDINPDLKIDIFEQGVNEENIEEFVDGARAAIDVIDYYAPQARRALHKAARERGQYVFIPPAGGLGCTLLCFSPHGPTIEEFFEYPEDPQAREDHVAPIQKLIGPQLEYLPDGYYEALERSQPSIMAIGVNIAGGLTASQVIKCLLYQEQQADESKFREYGQIELTTLPRALRLDAWDSTYAGVFNFSTGEFER